MTGTPQRSLNNNFNASSMNNYESKYIVSNDGVGVTEFRNSSPGKAIPTVSNPMNNGPKLTTPTLIPPLKYIVYNNPQEVYNLLTNIGYRVKPSIPSAYEFAKFYVRDRGEEAVLDIIRAAHPDKDAFFKAFGIKEKDTSSFNESSLTGTPTANTMPVPNTPADTKAETGEKPQGLKITSQAIIIILIVIIFFILITRK